MKNIIFILTFFVGFITFASNPAEAESFIYNETVCVPMTTSCGVEGLACGKTTGDILIAAQDLEEWQCP